MIKITKLNGTEIVINSELIESMEETPDTTITMTTGKKFIAKETQEQIIQKVITFKRSLLKD